MAIKITAPFSREEARKLKSGDSVLISGVIYTAVRQSFASECASRRTAMNAANKNAGEMISDLTLHYNRARQAAITQEITEIIAGSEAQ